MMAPLIERNASLDTCCLLFVNNFYFYGSPLWGHAAGRASPARGAGGGVMPIDT
jgi:hypothetical protein